MIQELEKMNKFEVHLLHLHLHQKLLHHHLRQLLLQQKLI
jgi:hypothetical protein